MLEDEEDPFIPSPSEARRFRRLDKMPEHERLKATVRMFLDAIWWVPMRAVDCDQLLVQHLWSRLCRETKPSRKKKRRSRVTVTMDATLTDAEREAVNAALGWCDDRDTKTITILRSLLARTGGER